MFQSLVKLGEVDRQMDKEPSALNSLSGALWLSHADVQSGREDGGARILEDLLENCRFRIPISASPSSFMLSFCSMLRREHSPFSNA